MLANGSQPLYFPEKVATRNVLIRPDGSAVVSQPLYLPEKVVTSVAILLGFKL